MLLFYRPCFVWMREQEKLQAKIGDIISGFVMVAELLENGQMKDVASIVRCGRHP